MRKQDKLTFHLEVGGSKIAGIRWSNLFTYTEHRSGVRVPSSSTIVSKDTTVLGLFSEHQVKQGLLGREAPPTPTCCKVGSENSVDLVSRIAHARKKPFVQKHTYVFELIF